jgi:hypothetical protein
VIDILRSNTGGSFVNIDKLREMLGATDRIKDLISKRDALGQKQVELGNQVKVIDDELSKLTGAREPATRSKQKCSLCGKEGHTKRTCKAA